MEIRVQWKCLALVAACLGAACSAQQEAAREAEVSPAAQQAAEAPAEAQVGPVDARREHTVLTASGAETRETMRLLVDEGLGQDPEVRDSLQALRQRSAGLSSSADRAEAEAAFGAWLRGWKAEHPERAAAARESLGEREVMDERQKPGAD